jgi:hypothetical protein
MKFGGKCIVRKLSRSVDGTRHFEENFAESKETLE